MWLSERQRLFELVKRNGFPRKFASRFVAGETLNEAKENIPNDRFEFQMLYGVRRDLQEKLHKNGYNMRVYVPFGTRWYPYLMRRLAERPTNVAFITISVLKEAFFRK